ncbi:MAG: hypothetical protein M3367_17170 [Acidobacteriota bacterium]|nr:hypothetical protein [Acidobacteriota bacterium]
MLYSRKFGAVASDNPWGADTLKWSTASPPTYNFQYISAAQGRHAIWERTEDALDEQKRLYQNWLGAELKERRKKKTDN